MSSIRTPDQRLRVFISSTIEELKDERRLVREAIEGLRLTPVFFEAGARPHPPRELYRAYLEQSDIFIGIYAKSYGWVAPDMSISGLEDEYRLSGNKPKLIYIKELESERDSRLKDLIDEIRGSGSMSYQKFRTPEQLADLLRNDLAVMLSERFAQQEDTTSKRSSLPAIRTATIGRERERQEIAALIMRPNTALVTLTGTGGTGKSHLALRVAHDVASNFADGAVFVPLASVQRAEQVLPAVAGALNIADTGRGSLTDAIVEQLSSKTMLLVIDNFEHVLDAAPQLIELSQRMPKLMLLVTSRGPLNLMGEQVYPVQPLTEPGESELNTEQLLANPAVDLFVQRAHARAAHLILDEANVGAIAEICRRLDGLPLAIELAAAHTKFFSPVALAARMQKSLDLLEHGSRDLPARQRTMRAAIASSVELLEEPHRAYFRRLAVMNERWTATKSAVVTDARGLGLVPQDAIERLVDLGLVRLMPPLEHELDNEPRFLMLHVMREFAAEQLDAKGEREGAMVRLQGWCVHILQELMIHATADDVMDHVDHVEENHADLRALIRAALDRGDVPAVWAMVSQMNSFLLLRGYRGEALEWLRKTGLEALAADPRAFEPMPAMLRGGVLFAAGTMCYYMEDLNLSIKYLEQAVELFKADDIPYSLRTTALFFASLALVANNNDRASTYMAAALAEARANGDRFLEGTLLCYSHELHVRSERLDLAEIDVRKAEAIQGDIKRGLLSTSLGLARGYLHVMKGEFEQGLSSLDRCVNASRQSRIAGTTGWACSGAGYCLLRLGRLDEARERFILGVEHSLNSGYRAALLSQWVGLAWLALLKGDRIRAARLAGAAEAQHSATRFSEWSVNKQMRKEAMDAVAVSMDEALLKAEMAIGAGMKLEEVNRMAVA